MKKQLTKLLALMLALFCFCGTAAPALAAYEGTASGQVTAQLVNSKSKKKKSSKKSKKSKKSSKKSKKKSSKKSSKKSKKSSKKKDTKKQDKKKKDSKKKDEYVWIAPDNGEKYHYEHCWTLDRTDNKQKLKLSEAKKKGYEACKVCHK